MYIVKSERRECVLPFGKISFPTIVFTWSNNQYNVLLTQHYFSGNTLTMPTDASCSTDQKEQKVYMIL